MKRMTEAYIESLPKAEIHLHLEGSVTPENLLRLAKKHEVHYFTMQYSGMMKEFEYEGMKIHAICKGPDQLYVEQRRKIGPAIKFTIFLLFTLFKYRFDAIDSNEFPHLHNVIVRFYCFLNRDVLFVGTWHEYWSQQYWMKYLGVLSGLFGFAIQVLSLKMPHKVIAVSSQTRELLIHSGIINPQKITVIPNGIDPDLIKEALRQKRPRKNTIICVGRLIVEKRVDLLIQVVKFLRRMNPNIQLIIIGDGPERKHLEQLGREIEAQFLGFIEEHVDVLTKVASSSVYVSMSEREGFNISALEACELGIPTFARSGWFQHPNLYKMTPDNLKLILEYVQVTPEPNLELSPEFAWDNIVKLTEKAIQLK